MNNKDYYAILGLSKSASLDEVKKAYRKLALKYHPDRGGDKKAEEKFKEINEAYQILSDPAKRQQYDQFGRTDFSAGGTSGGGGGFGGFDFSGFGGEGGGFGFGNFSDIFEDFFGQAYSQIQAEIKISPAQAVLGDHIKVSVGGQNLEFNIPPGTQSGTSFRFPGKGRTYRNNQHGDLILTINIEMPKNPTREQKELWQKIKDSEQQKKWWQ